MTDNQTQDLTGAVAIAGTLRWPAELRDEMRPVLVAIAARSRQDEGCIEYTWSEDLEEPGAFHFFEIWADQARLDAHLAADYEADFMRDHASRVIGATAYGYGIRSRTLMT
jgi:quinol monooxygenase YgiN